MTAWIARTAVVAGLLLPAALIFGPATSSARRAPVTSRAQGSTCTAWIQERANYPLKEQYRVGAECSHIDASEKARGTADFRLQGDAHTVWFTDAHVTHYSEWKTKSFFAPTARIDLEPR
jgi:hypothetical protein